MTNEASFSVVIIPENLDTYIPGYHLHCRCVVPGVVQNAPNLLQGG